jgi:hypothetical protein
MPALEKRRAAPATRYALVCLGCLFWLWPLYIGLDLVRRVGFFADAVRLVGVPAAMIAVTIFTGWLVARGRHAAWIVTFSTGVAFLAALWWLAIIGQSV